MKSEVEITDALNRCKIEHCKCGECPYNDIRNCSGELMKDVLTLLNKSDFEVMKEILKRSKEAGYYHYTAMSGRECLEIPFLRFDEEGNIL